MPDTLFENTDSTAVLSPCGTWRYRLGRVLDRTPKVRRVALFCGVNPSTADAFVPDPTVNKWKGFSVRNCFSEFIVWNPFAYRSKDVKVLATVADPIGPDNDEHLAEMIAAADVLIPCWGDRGKLPRKLRPRLDAVAAMLLASGKPVRIFGLTAGGDPMHPLMLGYDTPLTEWRPHAH